MASDGVNIMYTSTNDEQCPIIAYCYLDPDDVDYRKADPDREWRQSRIVDLIWWDSIDHFVCATENGFYTNEFIDPRFRILCRINTRCENPCIAANSDHLWIHSEQQIMVYNTDFQLIQIIDIKIAQSLTRSSFCLTDTCAAFAFIRQVKNNLRVLEIRFFDCAMSALRTIKMGLSETSAVVRSDGEDRFFVATGHQKFHILSCNGTMNTVNLGKQASILAVVNSHSIALTKSRSDLELVKC
jgi:hypothetical protein